MFSFFIHNKNNIIIHVYQLFWEAFFGLRNLGHDCSPSRPPTRGPVTTSVDRQSPETENLGHCLTWTTRRKTRRTWLHYAMLYVTGPRSANQSTAPLADRGRPSANQSGARGKRVHTGTWLGCGVHVRRAGKWSSVVVSPELEHHVSDAAT